MGDEVEVTLTIQPIRPEGFEEVKNKNNNPACKNFRATITNSQGNDKELYYDIDRLQESLKKKRITALEVKSTLCEIEEKSSNNTTKLRLTKLDNKELIKTLEMLKTENQGVSIQMISIKLDNFGSECLKSLDNLLASNTVLNKFHYGSSGYRGCTAMSFHNYNNLKCIESLSNILKKESLTHVTMNGHYLGQYIHLCFSNDHRYSNVIELDLSGSFNVNAFPDDHKYYEEFAMKINNIPKLTRLRLPRDVKSKITEITKNHDEYPQCTKIMKKLKDYPNVGMSNEPELVDFTTSPTRCASNENANDILGQASLIALSDNTRDRSTDYNNQHIDPTFSQPRGSSSQFVSSHLQIYQVDGNLTHPDSIGTPEIIKDLLYLAERDNGDIGMQVDDVCF